MCKFFSVVSNGDGKPLYFDWKLRRKCLKGELNYSPDSHTSIADYYGFKGVREDKLNKYEYNPLTKKFVIDQKNNPIDDSNAIREFCESLDFKTIIPKLIIKPIIHPFKDIKTKKITKQDLLLLKKWASVLASVRDSVRDSVWDSVWDSVGDSVRDSVGDSVRDSVWDSVGASVGDSVRASVWASVLASVRDSVWASVLASVRDSVRDSVWASVRDSVWDSVGAYISLNFDIKYKYDFTSAIKLWKKGLVPSFDGTLWRLHGYEGKILWEGKIKLKK